MKQSGNESVSAAGTQESLTTGARWLEGYSDTKPSRDLHLLRSLGSCAPKIDV